MKGSDIDKIIHDKWNEFSYELLMKKTSFGISDIENAFYESVDALLMAFGILNDKHEYVDEDYDYTIV